MSSTHERKQDRSAPGGSREDTHELTIQASYTIPRENFPLCQFAADALTQAGLGTYKYELAETQVIESRRNQQLTEADQLVAIKYTGQKDRQRLFDVFSSGRAAEYSALKEGKKSEEAVVAGQNAISKVVQAELAKKRK